MRAKLAINRAEISVRSESILEEVDIIFWVMFLGFMATMNNGSSNSLKIHNYFTTADECERILVYYSSILFTLWHSCFSAGVKTITRDGWITIGVPISVVHSCSSSARADFERKQIIVCFCLCAIGYCQALAVVLLYWLDKFIAMTLVWSHTSGILCNMFILTYMYMKNVVTWLGSSCTAFILLYY
jgi:hypothetical protein